MDRARKNGTSAAEHVTLSAQRSTAWASVMWSDAPAGRHDSYFSVAFAATAPAAAPVAAPITVPLVLWPIICPRIAPAIAPPMTFFLSAFASGFATFTRSRGVLGVTLPAMVYDESLT